MMPKKQTTPRQTKADRMAPRKHATERDAPDPVPDTPEPRKRTLPELLDMVMGNIRKDMEPVFGPILRTAPAPGENDPRRQLAAALRLFAERHLATGGETPTFYLSKAEGLLNAMRGFADAACVPLPLELAFRWTSEDLAHAVLVADATLRGMNGGPAECMRLSEYLDGDDKNRIIRHLDCYLLALDGAGTGVPLAPCAPNRLDPLPLYAKEWTPVDWRTECAKPSWDVCEVAHMLVCETQGGGLHTTGEDGTIWQWWPDRHAEDLADWLADPGLPPPVYTEGGRGFYWTRPKHAGVKVAPADVLARCDAASIPVPDGMRGALVQGKPKGKTRKAAARPTGKPRLLQLKQPMLGRLFNLWTDAKNSGIRTLEEFCWELPNYSKDQRPQLPQGYAPEDVRRWIANEGKQRIREAKRLAQRK